MIPKIPDEIYENRCRYCFHFCVDGENRDFNDKEVFSYNVKQSCKILAVSGHCYQVRRDSGTLRWEYENIAYTDGECRTFTPNFSYPGICQSCAHHNCFADGYCTVEKGEDYRIAVIANTHGSDEYGSNFFTCNKWVMSEFAKDCFLKDIISGKAPPIISPKTFKLLAPQKISEAANAWAEIRDKELAIIKEKQKQKEALQKVKKAEPEQLSLGLGV